MKQFLERAPLTSALLAAILASFVLETLLGGSTNTRTLNFLGANVPVLVQQGQVWRLVSSMFLHIGLMHLLVNGWALFQLGGLFETWMGSSRMALVYFVSGILGSVASVVTKLGSTVTAAGASGAIFGLMGALIAFLLRRRDRLLPAAKSLLSQLLLWAGLNVVLGFNIAGIDNAAHLGGCAAGFVLGWMVRPRWERRPPAGFQPAASSAYSEPPRSEP